MQRSRIEQKILDGELVAIDREEESEDARRGHQFRKGAIRAEFEKERDRLAVEYNAEKLRVIEARKKLDEKLDRLNLSIHQRRLEVRQAELELGRCKDIDPKGYLRLVLLPGRII